MNGHVSGDAKVDPSCDIPYSNVHSHSVVRHGSKVSYSDIGDRSVIDDSVIDYCGDDRPIRNSTITHSTVQYSSSTGSTLSDTSVRFAAIPLVLSVLIAMYTDTGQRKTPP